MINIQDKSKCCGCKACGQVCPKQCITFHTDEEGFWYPSVDSEMCVNCGLCEKVCPVLHQYAARKPLSTVAAINPDDNVRASSSSGGVFTLLAEKVIEQGGVVFGVAFEKDWTVSIKGAETIEALANFRGSKYIQADAGESFKICKQYLEEGRLVLFSGTPCQISSLKHFLRNDYENLITIDVVCHGVPSPGVWKLYLAEVTEAGQKAIRDIKFRDKRKGWRKFNFAIEYSKADREYVMVSNYDKNIFMRAFLNDLILRPSCYDCPAKGGRGHADITLADFWGAEHFVTAIDDDRGISLVLLNTQKGNDLLNLCCTSPIVVEYDEVCKYNTAIYKSCSPHPKRMKFFTDFANGCNVNDLIAKTLKPSSRQQVHQLMTNMKIVIKRILQGG